MGVIIKYAFKKNFKQQGKYSFVPVQQGSSIVKLINYKAMCTTEELVGNILES